MVAREREAATAAAASAFTTGGSFASVIAVGPFASVAAVASFADSITAPVAAAAATAASAIAAVAIAAAVAVAPIAGAVGTSTKENAHPVIAKSASAVARKEKSRTMPRLWSAVWKAVPTASSLAHASSSEIYNISVVFVLFTLCFCRSFHDHIYCLLI